MWSLDTTGVAVRQAGCWPMMEGIRGVWQRSSALRPQRRRLTGLRPHEMRTLEAICEALAPAVPPPEGETDPHGLYARSARDLPVAQLISEALAEDSPETRKDFKRLLSTLNSPLAGMVLAGRPQGFAQLTLAARETALRKMSTSSLGDLRQGFQAVKRLALFLFYAAPSVDGQNPNWPALGYVRPPLPPSPDGCAQADPSIAGG